MTAESISPDEGSESSAQALSFLRGLIDCGVRDFVVSPGSRSTPLVLGLRTFSPVRSRVILDERSAAFFALGLADSTRKPVALICTSGTACANYLPAVVEAFERGVPLLLLTADRPPELRDCGSAQTIDQIGLFGKFCLWSIDAIVPQGLEGAYELYRIAVEGVGSVTGDVRGPAHFNLPFREPFLPAYSGNPAIPDKPHEEIESPHSEVDWERIRNSGPGWILVGVANPQDSIQWENSVFSLSDYLGWPIFADVSNPLRHSSGAEGRVVTQYEGLIGSGLLDEARELTPKALVQIGILPTAKNLREILGEFPVPRWQCSPEPGGLDPSRLPFEWISAPPEKWNQLPDETISNEFRASWIAADKAMKGVVTDWLLNRTGNFEGKLHYHVSQSVPEGSQILVGNSLPARDAERFWFSSRSNGVRLFMNRGASGIDGMVSTAAGLAEGGIPTFAILGDLTFLHDVGGLRAAARTDGSLTFIVIDNGGGRIFGQLPIRSETEIFEEYFLTPQSVDFQKLCEAHEIPFKEVHQVSEVAGELQETRPGARVILVRINSDDDATARQEWKKLFERFGTV
ncbi:MAG: 2-succinyl-5-enolpyruvyl-6-hydroxy-3-cyclohexene-1-carboxylic-acid synthase [Verrucomicrobiota bacterium]